MKKRTYRRGAAAVEFAFVAPIFLMFTLGIMEFGRAIMVQNVLVNASREGARYAIIDGASSSQAASAATSFASSAGVSGISVSISPTDLSTATSTTPIVVTAFVPFSQVSWLPGAHWLSGKTLSAKSTMRKESFN